MDQRRFGGGFFFAVEISAFDPDSLVENGPEAADRADRVALGAGFGFHLVAVPVQVEGPHLFVGKWVSGEPTVFGGQASRPVHRLVGARQERERGVGAHDFQGALFAFGRGGEMAQGVVRERRGAFGRGLTLAPVRDGPEFFGPRPRDASVGGTAHVGDLAPAGAVVVPDAGLDRGVAVGDEDAAVGSPELDVADPPESGRDVRFLARRQFRGHGLFQAPGRSFAAFGGPRRGRRGERADAGEQRQHDGRCGAGADHLRLRPRRVLAAWALARWSVSSIVWEIVEWPGAAKLTVTFASSPWGASRYFQ